MGHSQQNLIIIELIVRIQFVLIGPKCRFVVLYSRRNNSLIPVACVKGYQTCKLTKIVTANIMYSDRKNYL